MRIDPPASAVAHNEDTSQDLPRSKPPHVTRELQARPEGRTTLAQLIKVFLQAPTTEDLIEMIPQRIGDSLRCKRILLYLVRGDALEIVGGTATTDGWSSTLIHAASIHPIPLTSSAPEARVLFGEQAIFERGNAEMPPRVIAPMLGLGGPVGTLVIVPASDEPAWGADGVHASQSFMTVLEEVARITGAILQHRQLFQENQRRADEMTLLTRLTTAFNSSVLDLDAAIGIVERQISQITKAYLCTVVLGQPVGPGPLLTGRGLPHELIKILLQQQMLPVYLDSIDNWPPAQFLPPGIASFYAFPLLADERVVGLLALAFRQPHKMEEGERHLLSILTNTASTVLQKSRLQSEAEHARQQARSLLAGAQREERFKDAILRNMQSGLITVDTVGRVSLMNPMAALILGGSEKRALGLQIEEVFAVLGAGVHPVRASLGPRMPPRRCEVQVRHPDGRELTLSLVVTPLLQGDGKDLGVICSFQDITEIRALRDQAKQLDQSSRDVSHDIRGVAGGMMLALDSFLPALAMSGNTESRVALNRLQRDTGRLKSLAENIMTLGRPQLPQKKQCDASELIEQVLRIVGAAISVAHIRIERQLEAGTTILADEHQIMRVLENLFNNAIEAMPGGGVLTVKSRTTRDTTTLTAPADAQQVPPTGLLLADGKWALEIDVADTGVGIPAERLDAIWEPFATFGKRNGHGLGLAIVRQVIEAHGGGVSVSSGVGKGTTFTLRLPTGR